MAVHEVLIDPRGSVNTTFSKPITTGFSIPSPSMVSSHQVMRNEVSNNGDWTFNFKSKGSIITGVLILVVVGLLVYTSTKDNEKTSKSSISRQNIQYF
jgi:hypothetical protein